MCEKCACILTEWDGLGPLDRYERICHAKVCVDSASKEVSDAFETFQAASRKLAELTSLWEEAKGRFFKE